MICSIDMLGFDGINKFCCWFSEFWLVLSAWAPCSLWAFNGFDSRPFRSLCSFDIDLFSGFVLLLIIFFIRLLFRSLSDDELVMRRFVEFSTPCKLVNDFEATLSDASELSPFSNCILRFSNSLFELESFEVVRNFFLNCSNSSWSGLDLVLLFTFAAMLSLLLILISLRIFDSTLCCVAVSWLLLTELPLANFKYKRQFDESKPQCCVCDSYLCEWHTKFFGV